MSRVQRIFLKNIKAIDEQELVLHGCSALITAGNNKGKTTLLTALPHRLLSKKPTQILRKGTSEGVAEIELTNGEKFVWEIQEDKEKLTFITSEGLPKPLVKEISRRYFAEPFDIDKFLNEGPKKQAEMLQKLVGLDFTELDKEYEKYYEERTYFKKRLYEAESQKLKYDDRIPTEKINISDMQNAYTEAVEHNNLIHSQKQRIENIDLEIEELRKKAILLKHEKAEIEAKLASSKSEINTQELKSEIEVAINKNSYIEKNIKARDHQLLLDKYRKDVDEVEEKIQTIQNKRIEKLKSAKLPAGVEITPDGLLVDGFELNKRQLSLSKIYITALKISSLGLGEVRMQFFDASPLDKNSLLEIEKWAAENDLQLLIEKPDFDGGEIKYEIINETE